MVKPTNHFRRLLAVTTALGMLAPVFPAWAQDAGSDASTATPPERVGEIAALTGNVTYNGAGSNSQWVAATRNYPIATGDSLFTQDSSQVTMAIDSSRITLAPQTELQITSIDNDTLAATESQGEMFLAVNDLQQGQSFAITTPRGAVTISQNGNYDIVTGDQNNPTIITVLSGAATVSAPGASLQIPAGQDGVLSGTTQTTAQLGQAQTDAFMTAMLAEQAPPPPAYAPPVVQQMTGVSQLGAYGDWQQSPQYGAVWYPQVAAGWAPYHQGHWAYVQPWGYTWVDDAPWGFAPFHYGRWFNDGGRWGWAPAPDYSQGGGYGPDYRPIYAPAVVSFFGAGIAVGITIGALASGSVGWVPLGPGEAYYPNYRCPPDYIRRINVVNVRNINIVNIHNTTINNYNYNNFANRRAATYIPADAMSRGEQVRDYGKPVPDAMLASARPIGPEGFAPKPGEHGGPMALPPPSFTHHAVAPPPPSAFGERHSLPPAVFSHEPAPQLRPGQPFAGPRPAAEQTAPNHAFSTMPGYHAPPPPPGEHGQMPGSTPGFHPQAMQPEGMNHMAPAPQHPGFAAEPGYHAPPAPPMHESTQPFHPEEKQPGESARPNVIYPSGESHAPSQPAYHPPAQQSFHPAVQQYHPPVEQYHPPVQQYHPPVEQYHPPAQESHPQAQFHPQEQPRPQPPAQHDDSKKDKHPS